MQKAIEMYEPKYCIHLGDCVRDVEELRQLFPMLAIAQVRGNCDYGVYDIPETRVLEYGGVKVMMCHGHRFGVKSGLLRIKYASMENCVNVSLFGHTHCPYCEEQEGVWLLNPGSCGYSSRPSCGLIEIEKGNVFCRILPIEER